MTSRFPLRRFVIPAAALGAVAVGGHALDPHWGAADARQNVVQRPVVPRGDLAADERSTIDLFRRASPSVVYITTLQRVVNLWTRNVTEVPQGTGSGFFWDDQGHVVTNYHVIQGAQGAHVRMDDQRSYPAQLVGVSPEHDLAVLRISVPARKPGAIPLGSSKDLQVGQRVIAIGNPFGLDHTLTTGVISALNRSIPGERGSAIHGMIQTDASINPGNSGGPLIDSAGRLIGVNTAIFSPSGASAGIGFAVPVDTVNRVVPELIATGRYQRPQLGLIIDERFSRKVTEQLGVKGLLVIDVEPRSGASAAGLRGSKLAADGSLVVGDIIVALDGAAVDSPDDLQRGLDGKRFGDRVNLRVLRDGRPLELTVTLAEPRR